MSPSLSTGKTGAAPAKPPGGASALNTATVRPAQVSPAKRFVPHYVGEPVAGFTHGIRNPDGSWQKPGGRAVPGATLGERPYYTDRFTTRYHAGPAGDPSTQWNAAQVAKAKQIQIANYGTPGYILRSMIPGGLDEGGAKSAAEAVARGADIASWFVPPGAAVKGAGLFGLGIKGLKGIRGVKDVAEGAPKAAHVFEATPGAGAPEWMGFLGKGAPGISREPHPTGEHFIHRDASGNPDGTLTIYKNAEGKPTRMAVVVRPDARRQGIATALYGAAERAGVNVRSVMGKESLTPEGAAFLNSLPGPPAAHTSDAAAVVRAALPGAKVVRGQQEAGYSPARVEKVAAASRYMDDQSLSPAERIAKAKVELRGELPKINYKGFSELNDESVQVLQADILNHPHLPFFQRLRLSEALTGALGGRVPTRSEIVLFERVFGKETAAGLDRFAKDPLREKILNVLNIPRSLMASFNLSAPFRQGLVVAARHPVLFARNLGPMVKAFGSEGVYNAMINEIRARQTYPLMVEAKLPITELGRDIGGREERFASDYAEKLTGGKYSPVRASGRAYVGFLDKTRADVFDHLLQRAQAQGVNVHDQHFLESLGRYIGSATGRGDLRVLQGAAKELNAVFFSPRLMASRFNFLSPNYYYRLHPFARKEALRSAFQLAGTVSTMLALSSRVPGVKVQLDPRNPDWGKIRIGNTRIDIAGGFQQELRVLAQIATGVAIDSQTGKKLSLTAGGFGQPTRLDIALRYFEGKLSPIASLIADKMRGSTQIGQKFTWKSAAIQRMIPLLAQDSADLYKENHGGMNGLLAAFAGYGVGSVGIGVQTYGPPAPKSRATGGSSPFDPPTSRSGGSSPFDPPSSGGGGSSPFSP